MITKNGAFLGTTGNLPQDRPNDPLVSHHLTMTGDIAGGPMKIHDTFQVGSNSINLSGTHYNNLASTENNFDPSPSPEAARGFQKLFD